MDSEVGLQIFQAYRCVAIGHIDAAKVISLTICLDDRGNFEWNPFGCEIGLGVYRKRGQLGSVSASHKLAP